jgi:hypothetical protein
MNDLFDNDYGKNLYCCQCGIKLNRLIMGGVISGQWIDFTRKDFSRKDEPVHIYYCTECFEKIRELRSKK